MSVVGLCGAGVMGRAAAGKILASGRSVSAFEVSEAARAAARALGVDLAPSPAEVMRRADPVILFLPGPSEVEACVTGPEGLLSAAEKGKLIVDMSTVEPRGTQRMAEAARQKGVGYLDAPVLGLPGVVGRWALPVGGEAADLERARPVLDLVADKIFHIGPSGSGNRVKLLNQMMFGAINAMTAEMMAIAAKMGVPPRLLYETITASQAATVSNLFKVLGKRITDEDYGDPTFTVDLLVKDVRLAVRMAQESHALPLLGRVVEFLNETAQLHGYGSQDTAVMWKCLYDLMEKKQEPPPGHGA